MKIDLTVPCPKVTITLESWDEIYEMCHRMNCPLDEKFLCSEVPGEHLPKHSGFSHAIWAKLRDLVVNANVSS